MEPTRTGHFIVCTGEPGAQRFTCTLVAKGNHLAGEGVVTQALDPAVDIRTQLDGTSSELVWNDDTVYSLQLTGHAPGTVMPPHPANVEASILLDSAETRGTASYRYQQSRGQDEPLRWIKLTNVPVTVAWSQPAP